MDAGYGNGYNVNAGIYDASVGYISIKLTEELINLLTTYTDWGYSGILQWENLVLEKITYYEDNSIGDVIWEGSEPISWTGMNALAWGGYDWSTVSAGQTLTAFFTLDPSAEYRQIRFGNGSWASLPSGIAIAGGEGNIPLTEDATSFSLTLTQDDIDMLVDKGGLVMTGTGYTLTKLALK